MPRIVDRTQRRREIAEALLRIVARDGIETVSVRTVAAEAGLSAGAVQKYFATKEEMFGFAFTLTTEFLVDRWESVPRGGNSVDELIGYVRAALPLDERRRAETVVVLAFVVRASTHGDWAPLRDDHLDAQRLTVDFLRAGQDAGHVRSDVAAAQLADTVLALADGYAQRMLHTPPRSPTHATLLAALEFALRDLLTPRCRPV